jgi:hypothetical protein
LLVLPLLTDQGVEALKISILLAGVRMAIPSGRLSVVAAALADTEAREVMGAEMRRDKMALKVAEEAVAAVRE